MAIYKQIGYGSTGDDVTKLQELLNKNGDYKLQTDSIFGDKTKAAVTDYQQKNGLKASGVVDEDTWNALNRSQSAPTSATTAPAETKAPTFEYTPYKPSDTVAQAEALLQQQMAQKPGAYQSTWAGQLKDTIAQILNREKFTYDLNEDALYQQYREQYVNQGKLAMMDAMGQAAALTSGYGSSFAQNVGQQAYQDYLQKLNAVVPELYGMARDQHNQEEQRLYDQVGLLAQMDDQEYGRYRDQLSDYYTELGLLTEDARYKAEQDYGRWADHLNFTYGQFADDRAYAYQQDRDKIADQQWQAQFDEAKRQYDQQYALSKSKSSGSGGSGGGGYDNGGYDASVVKQAQVFVGASEDGKWGQNSQAAAKKLGYNSLADVVAAMGDGPTATDATDAFEKKIHPESQHDAIARKMYGSYRNYVDKEIQSALKNGEISENDAVWLYSKYGIYD